MDSKDGTDRLPRTTLNETLPTGTVTILFTDVEGSTRLWERNPAAMKQSLARHDAILHKAVRSHHGQVVKELGDGMLAVFPTARDALVAAATAQAALTSTDWGLLGPLRVRMSLHVGEPENHGGDYFGPVINRTARLMAAAHGGQVIVSQVTEGLVRDALPEGFDLMDLGEHRLRDLSRAERVFQLIGPGLETRFPRLRSLDAFKGNLPTQLTSFVGRDSELAAVAKALAQARVVTLTGVGGVGKTRLALQTAAELLPNFPDGAWLCELASVGDPGGVGAAMAAVFGVKISPVRSPTETLVEVLGSKRLLLVVDNCEHLLDAVAKLIRELARQCPGLAILATSREGLAIDGERIVPIPSLAPPSPDAEVSIVGQSDAVRLFVDRAAATKAGFALTQENAGSVAEICRRLDGIPLALELAAARVVAISPSELARRLNQRFELLAGGRRGAVKRHQTLRAAIDWSYALLSKHEQRMLGRLSVFAGGWTLEAAEAVTIGDGIGLNRVLDYLTSLVRQSLVIADDLGAGETRFRLLETIREYAEERLQQQGEVADIRSRHAQYFAGWTEAASHGLRSPDEASWIRRVAQAQGNLKVALAWAIESDDADVALHLLAPAKLMPMNDLPVTSALGSMAEAVLELSGAPDLPRFVDGLLVAADHAWSRGDLARADHLCDQAEDAGRRLGTPPDGYIFGQRGVTALSAGRINDAKNMLAKALAITRANGDAIEVAEVLSMLASLRARDGDVSSAVADADDGLIVARHSGNPSAIADCAYRLGSLLVDTEPERAQTLLAEAIGWSEPLGVPQPSAYGALALIAAGKGAHEEALRLAAQAIDLLAWFQGRFMFGYVHHVVARSLASDVPEAAAVLLGTGSVREPGEAMLRQMVRFREETTQIVTAILGEARFRELHTLGSTMDNDHANTYVRTQISAVLEERAANVATVR